MALCNQCGKELREHAAFCTNCGAPAVRETTTKVAQSPVQYSAGPEPAPFTPATPVYGAPPAYAPAGYGMRPMYRPSRNITFVNSFLVITLLVALCIAAMITGAAKSSMFFLHTNIINLFMQFCILSSAAFAATLSARAKGPDLSVGALMGFTTVFIAANSAMFDSPVSAALVTIAVCAVIGLINGALITLLRIPAIIVTVLTGVSIKR